MLMQYNQFSCYLVFVHVLSEVMSTFPIPLLNRLEKHTLSTSSILTDEQGDLKNELEKWVENFHKRRLEARRQMREPARTISLRATFAGYNLDLVPSLLRKAASLNASSGSASGEGTASLSATAPPVGLGRQEILRHVKQFLLQLATPDAVLRSSSNKSCLVAKEADELRVEYFERQHHHHLRDFLRGRLDSGALFAVVTTHDIMKDSVSGSSLEDEAAWAGHFSFPETEKGHLVRLGQ